MGGGGGGGVGVWRAESFFRVFQSLYYKTSGRIVIANYLPNNFLSMVIVSVARLAKQIVNSQ